MAECDFKQQAMEKKTLNASIQIKSTQLGLFQ